MNSEILHNIKDTPFNERETFNNAILLLSMVKSEYYYIVGFSRPDNKIEIGFDFEDSAYGKISEAVTMSFSGDSSGIKVATKLANVLFVKETAMPFSAADYFAFKNGCVYYDRVFEKDDVIPASMDKLNGIILSVKKELGDFINQALVYILNQGRK
ncbi:MAG: hypothetical protein IKY78_10780 [Clostridia bacterium]|nr:hypothetical protein [Clostridia bacterium]